MSKQDMNEDDAFDDLDDDYSSDDDSIDNSSESDSSESNATDNDSDSDDDDHEQGDCCAYCGFSDVSALAKCNDCGKYFCNVNSGRNGSHIIQHFTISRHKGLCTHPDSYLHENLIECLNCSMHDVFRLGYMTYQDTNQYGIICSECCSSKSMKEQGWNVDNYNYIVTDKTIQNWLVACPSKSAYTNIVSITEIRNLEDAWKLNPGATLNELISETQVTLQKLSISYDDALEYSNSFLPVLDEEMNEDRKQKESEVLDNISVTWSIGSRRNLLATFNVDFEDMRSRISLGDELKLSCGGVLNPLWNNSGLVHSIVEDSVTLEFKNMYTIPTLPGPQVFRVQFCFNDITYKRMKDAINSFLTRSKLITPFIYQSILGRNISIKDNIRKDIKIPTTLSAPNLPELNYSQIDAIKSALISNIALIQGPPGTGKTVTSATLIYQLLKLNPYDKILVCTPSNISCDHLAAKLHQTNLRVIRVAAKTRESISSTVRELCLHVLAPKIFGTESTLYQLHIRQTTKGDLSEKEVYEYKKLLTSAENYLLDSAQVICATCSTSGDGRLRGLNFSTVLIDESTQAIEPETLIPIMHGCKQLILVGDHQQLGPVIISKEAQKAGLDYSLFERLQLLGFKPSPLTVQYRMHPALSEFPSTLFYDGILQNGISQADRYRPNDFEWPNPTCPMMFWAQYGSENQGNGGVSYMNRSEASAVDTLVTCLLKNNVLTQNIGVITPYEAQRVYIKRYMRQYSSLPLTSYEDLEIASVDSYQGREKDYIIFSCVRSNHTNGLGFLVDPRRLNVAITRAKYGLFIVGNPNVLQFSPLWNNLLKYYQYHNCLVEGIFNSFRYYTNQLVTTKPFVNTRSIQLALDKHQHDLEQSKGQASILDTSLLTTTDLMTNSFLPSGLQYISPIQVNNETDNSMNQNSLSNTGIEQSSVNSSQLPNTSINENYDNMVDMLSSAFNDVGL